MENYKEKVNQRQNHKELYGSEAPSDMRPRLQQRTGEMGYGRVLFDAKIRLENELKENSDKISDVLFECVSLEKIKEAAECLRNGEPLPSVDDEVWPVKMIVFREKHGDASYDVTTREKLRIVALKVFMQRCENRDYFFPKPIEPENPEKDLGLSIEQVENLPHGELKKIAKRRYDSYKIKKKEYENNIFEYNLIDVIIEKKVEI